MKKLFVILFVFYYCTSFGQVKIKKMIIKDPIKGLVEEFHVLKNDKTVRHGDYKRVLRGNHVASGNFKNGVKQIFNFYDQKNEIVLSYNYAEKKVLEYYVHDIISVVYSTNYTRIEVDRPPLSLFSPLELRYFIAMNVKYPREAVEKGISGKPLIAVTISDEGKIVNFKVFKSAHRLLDKAAISAVKMLDETWLWLPAEKDDKKIESVILIPINFSTN